MTEFSVRQALGFLLPGRTRSVMTQGIFSATVIRRLLQMVGWRVLALSMGAAGSIWAARCLGPAKLGISGMIIATITQLVLLVDLNQNAHLVRVFKGLENPDQRLDLIGTVFTFRLILCLGAMLVAGTVCLIVPMHPDWRVGLWAAFPLFFVNCNQGIWVLQAQENQPAQYRAGAVQAVIAASAYLLLFRPGVAAGWDVVVQVAAVGASWFFMWRWAAGPKFSQLWRPRRWAAALPLVKEGRWLMLTGIVVYIYTQSEAPLLGYLSSIEEMGKYRSAMSLVGVAQSFLTMIPILLYPRFIEWLKEGPRTLWTRQIRLAGAAIAISIPIIAAAFLLSPRLFPLVFGRPFAAAALPFSLLLTSKLVVVVNGIFGWGLWAMKKDKHMLVLMVIAAAFSMSSNLFLIPRFGMTAAASINLASELLILVGCFWLTRQALSRTSS